MFYADYTTPELILRVEDIGAIAVAVTAILGLIIFIGKISVWLDRRRDDNLTKRVKEILEPIIKEATLPIQPNTNGGLSLPDVHTTLASFDNRFSAIEAKLGIHDRRDPPLDGEI